MSAGPNAVTAAGRAVDRDAFDVRRARHAPAVLREFNDAGVLDAADVHVARRLGARGVEEDAEVLLAAALAARAPRLGHVCIDLTTARDTVTPEAPEPLDPRTLPWPDADTWPTRLAASSLVTAGDEGPSGRPLRLVGTRLYPERYWRQERRVATELAGRSEKPVVGVDHQALAAGLARLFRSDGPDSVAPHDGQRDENPPGAACDLPRLATATAVLRHLAVIAGGPGTGKTTTVARILALLAEQSAASGQPLPRVALTAPTGKAAARLQEAVHAEAGAMDLDAATRSQLSALQASTLHRLLGPRPDSHSRFRHHAGNRLPHDVVVVDETSMVSLSLMAGLVQAVRDRARLVLVGDPNQLASVEAGAVLGDIVGPAAEGLRARPVTRQTLTSVTGRPVPGDAPPGGASIGDSVVVLRRGHRYGQGIAALAEAVRAGDADAAVTALRDGEDAVAWLNVDVAGGHAAAQLEPVRRAVVAADRQVIDAARAGDAPTALAALGAMRLLCAHRGGPYGVATWTPQVEQWLRAASAENHEGGRWYVGQPLLVTENDHGLRLHNGDVGVVVEAGGDGLSAVFARGDTFVRVQPSRLAAVETAHAVTIHKSQGSQFDRVAVVLPEAGSPVLTRELLYTAVTRARTSVTVIGPEASVRAAVARPIARASGLRDALWEDG